MSIQNVSFKAQTQNGNHYKKTRAGLITGTLVGACITAKRAKEAKEIKLPTMILRLIAEQRQKAIAQGFTKEQAHHIIKNSIKSGLGANIALTGILFVILGATIDKIVNSKRAKNADKIA